MDVKRWIHEHKKATWLTGITAYILLRAGGWMIIWQFLLVGAIPGTQYSVPSGIMLILFGVVVWSVFCQRSAAHYLRQYSSSRQHHQSTVSTSSPRPRFSQI